jgi:hypothetical protein
MLNVQVTIDDKALTRLGTGLQPAIRRGLGRIVKGVHRKADDNLSGAGGLGRGKVQKYTGFTRKSGEAQTFRNMTGSGKYPVPVRTGNLRRLLDFVLPGQTKSSGGKTFSSSMDSVIVFDSALYAMTIHEGKGSSAKFGRRAFLTDGLLQFDTGGRMRTIMEEEVGKLVKG